MRHLVSTVLITGFGSMAGVTLAQGDSEAAASAVKSGEKVTAVPRSNFSEEHPEAASQASADATDLDVVTVTGTRIRGGTTPSPVITIESENIREEGFTDLGEVIRSIPRNFAGGQNPGVVAGAEGGGIANQNISGGSSLNLRGLGPDATLTLLNGRRLAYSGFLQAVDIDAIPIAAIDRLEIIPDGASAIYGSDAVAGVGNVILKPDYEGVSIGARYGGASRGGLVTNEYDVTAGTSWRNGGLIATWKKANSGGIRADQRNYTAHLRSPTSLFPESDLLSGLVSAHQAIGSAIELQIDALRTERDQLVHYPATADNYFPATAASKITFVSPGLRISLPNDWTSSTWMSWGEDDTLSALSMGLRSSDARVPLASTAYRNKTVAYEANAEGKVFAMPGGDARLSIGAGYRRNVFRQKNLISDTIAVDGIESSRFAYAELYLPLVGADQQVSGVKRWTATAALRNENYDSFGTVVTPKLGLVHGVTTGITLKTSWGKAFKAPTLLQRYQAPAAYLYAATAVGGSGFPAGATVLMPYGGNPGLKPERATTRSATIAFHPGSIRRLEAEATWFDIDFSGRIAQPLVYQAEALTNPVYARFIQYAPTQDDLETALAGSRLSNFSGAPYDPDQVVAIAFNRYINTLSQSVRGLDFSGSYRLDVGKSRLSVRGSMSWLRSSQRRTAEDPAHDLAGTLFNPPKAHGRIGAVWSRGALSATGFANYIGGVANTVDGKRTASFTTLDTTLRYAIQESRGPLSSFDVTLSATNVLDRAPPLYAPTSMNNPPYDSTNYSPIGRFLSVSVSKRW